MIVTHEVSATERARLYIEEACTGVIGATKGLSPAQWNFKPAPDRWSIAGILEHMVIIQERVLGPVREQLADAPAAAGQDGDEVDSIVQYRFPDRTVRFHAPDPVHPRGGFSPAALIDRLLENSSRLVQYVETAPDLREHAIDSPPLKAVTNGRYEKMDGYQWVLAAAAHTVRHTKQILEVKAAPGFPLQE